MKTFRMMNDGCKLFFPGNRRGWLLAGLLSFIIHHSSLAQLNSWQTHFNYQSGQAVALVGDKVYSAAGVGLFYYDRTTGEVRTLSKIDGLSDVDIRRLLYLPDQNRLLLAYANGNLDFLSVSVTGDPGEVKNVNTILTAPNITTSRTIYSLNRVGNNAYLGTDFGLVVLDLTRDEIRDTYFSPRSGNRLGTDLFSTVVVADTLFALSATPGFPRYGSLLQAVRLAPNVNIQDPANWRLIPTPDLLSSIATNQGRLVVTIDQQGVYERQNGRWVLTRSLPGEDVNVFSAPNGYVLFQANFNRPTTRVVTLPNSTSFSSPLLTTPRDVVADGNQVWVADLDNGLLAGNAGSFTAITPNGPSSRPGILYAYPQTLLSLHDVRRPFLDIFPLPTKQWYSLGDSVLFNPFRTAAYLPNEQRLYLGGDDGLWSLTDGQRVTPIVLSNLFGSRPSIHSLATDLEGNLWIVTNPEARSGSRLFVRRADGNFQVFSAAESLNIRFLVPDDNGFLWLITSGNELAVFDPQTNRSRSFFLSTNTLVKDRTGVVWVGTNQGPLVFDNPAAAFDPAFTPQPPLLNRRRLLSNESITSIAVDGGNRKWLGTRNGLYLVAPDGSQLLEAFTATNSPLPSNVINQVVVEPISGRVFIQTDRGLVSYQGAATEPAETLSNLTIYPNPVRPDFTGTVGINGLTENATVKILDAGGQLTYETRSQGGTATWDLRDYRGQPAQTGIYLVVVVTANGSERLAGKLAIVR